MLAQVLTHFFQVGPREQWGTQPIFAATIHAPVPRLLLGTVEVMERHGPGPICVHDIIHPRALQSLTDGNTVPVDASSICRSGPDASNSVKLAIFVDERNAETIVSSTLNKKIGSFSRSLQHCQH